MQNVKSHDTTQSATHVKKVLVCGAGYDANSNDADSNDISDAAGVVMVKVRYKCKM